VFGESRFWTPALTRLTFDAVGVGAESRTPSPRADQNATLAAAISVRLAERAAPSRVGSGSSVNHRRVGRSPPNHEMDLAVVFDLRLHRPSVDEAGGRGRFLDGARRPFRASATSVTRGADQESRSLSPSTRWSRIISNLGTEAPRLALGAGREWLFDRVSPRTDAGRSPAVSPRGDVSVRWSDRRRCAAAGRRLRTRRLGGTERRVCFFRLFWLHFAVSVFAIPAALERQSTDAAALSTGVPIGA
jgi:hypothetical protein